MGAGKAVLNVGLDVRIVSVSFNIYVVIAFPLLLKEDVIVHI